MKYNRLKHYTHVYSTQGVPRDIRWNEQNPQAHSITCVYIRSVLWTKYSHLSKYPTCVLAKFPSVGFFEQVKVFGFKTCSKGHPPREGHSYLSFSARGFSILRFYIAKTSNLWVAADLATIIYQFKMIGPVWVPAKAPPVITTTRLPAVLVVPPYRCDRNSRRISKLNGPTHTTWIILLRDILFLDAGTYPAEL